MTESVYTLSAASALTEYSLQADVLDADHQFEAVHTRDGGAMLFFIGSGDVLCVAREESGKAHGWSRADLSSAQTRKDFPWGASCKTFTAVQGEAGTIDLAMVLSDGSDDYLYLSLGNSDSDTAWCDDPAWLACPFNAELSMPPSTLHISHVLISDASDRYVIVVDIVANPGQPVQMMRRYHLDLSTPRFPEWVPHYGGAGPVLAGQVSCLGRTAHARGAEGIYTLGSFAGGRKLLYTPLYGLGGERAARATELQLPGSRIPDAITTCRNTDNTSDLYVAARGSLYYFSGAAPHQEGAVPLVHSPLFNGVRTLRAIVARNRVVVWGLNGDGQVFYTSCQRGHSGRAGAWSRPLCTLTGVAAMSPFFDRRHGALVLLARAGDGLVKAVKSPVTGLWSRRSITFPPTSLLQAPMRMPSYVTCIRVADADGNAAAGAAVMLSASSVTSVYINNLYRMVGPVPISVAADSGGALTIVETVDGLAGTRFEASAGGGSVAVNPMDAAFSAAAALIENRALCAAYQTLDGRVHAAMGEARPGPIGYREAWPCDVGDLFSWLDSGAGGTVKIVHDPTTGLWHAVAAIGGQVYHGVLDCVEKIVAATLWLLASVRTGVRVGEGGFAPSLNAGRQRPTLH